MMEIARVSMRDRRRREFVRAELIRIAIEVAPIQNDGGYSLFDEIYGSGMYADKTPGLLDEIDEAGIPITERCVNSPHYQEAHKKWFAHQKKRREAFKELRTI